MKYYILFAMLILPFCILIADSDKKMSGIIEKNRLIYNYYSEKCGDLMVDAMQKCIEKLTAEKSQLVKEDNLQTAASLKQLIKKISDNNDFSREDFKDFPQKIQILCNTYLHRKQQVEELYSDSSKKLKEKILNEITAVPGVSESIISSLKELFESDKFDYLDVEEIITDGKPNGELTVQEKNKQKTSNEISEEIDNILKSAFPLANNLIASNPSEEKGKLLFLYIEKIKPDNEKTKILRRNAERKSYIPIVPTVMNEEQFEKKLEQLCLFYLNNAETNETALCSAALLLYLHPDTKLKSQINSTFNNPDIHTILNYNGDLFGGSEEAEDLKLQLSIANQDELEKILKQAENLRKKYPKNLDVKDLMDELKKKLKIKNNNIEEHNTKTAHSSLSEDDSEEKFITCPKCHGKKKILCPQCIGSGISSEQEICPKCKGKGKSWLGAKCTECNGTGFVKRKIKCLNCNGTGQIVCPECHGTGKIPVK